MDLLSSPFQRTSVAKPIQRTRFPRPLKLLYILHPTLVGFGALVDEQSIPILSVHRVQNGKQHKQKTSLPTTPPPNIPSTHRQAENMFINALVQAALCPKHSRIQSHLQLKSRRFCTYHKSRRRDLLPTGNQTRWLHHISNTRPAITRASPSREEYLNLVDTYRELYSTQAQWMEPTLPPHIPIFLPSMPTNSMPLPATGQFGESFLRPGWKGVPDRSLMEHRPDPPLLPDDTQVKPANIVQKSQENEPLRPDVSNLLRVLKNANCDQEEAYKAYSLLPPPGVTYLSEEQIRLLLRRLSTSKRKSPQAALRYFSVFDEMRNHNLPMVQAEWNSAIAFCGQCFARIGASEVEDALLIWNKMKNEAKIESNNVTFNILFDMAAKAGKFVLADMIMKEMEIRGMEYNRFFRVGNIYFNGLKGDGDGVRRAYGELVEAGEIVDTLVMNCVIAALISAGEIASAENVYERMKRLISSHTGELLPVPRTWQEDRDLGRNLNRLVRRRGSLKKDRARLRVLKDQISIMPNIHTFTIFIEHHASQTGDLHRISSILREMQSLGVAINSRVFLKLFKGFSKHGSEPLTAWTLERLNKVWNSLLAVLDEGKEDVKVGKWMVVWIVRAFHQCAGRDSALQVFAKVQEMQKLDRKDLESVHTILWDVLKA